MLRQCYLSKKKIKNLEFICEGVTFAFINRKKAEIFIRNLNR